MTQERKSRAFNLAYASTRQMVLSGFETPFERELNPDNRWVVLSKLIPWDDICPSISRQLGNSDTGPVPQCPHSSRRSDYQISL
jgi:hypothetical protein